VTSGATHSRTTRTNMRSTTVPSLGVVICALLMAAPSLAQQASPPPRSSATTPSDVHPVPSAQRPTAMPGETPPPTMAQTRRSDRALPQGFSVVLVLGDIQGTTTSEEVPLAARKALTDMRDFLPFKSYKLLDAAWVLCCGQDLRSSGSGSGSGSGYVSQVLRGPDDQEYDLRLSTSRADNSQVSVRFTLFGSASSAEAGAGSLSGAARTTARRIADLKDRRTLTEKQIREARANVEVGVASGGDLAKLELELRRIDREIQDLEAQLTEARAPRATTRTSAAHPERNTIIDTTFTMNVGETVVVGTSRLRGGAKALIALLTAVPPRTSTERRE
jgi:hypothetical protein